VVFTDPGLVKAQAVEQLYELEIPLETERRILVNLVEWCQENSVPQVRRHRLLIPVGAPRLSADVTEPNTP